MRSLGTLVMVLAVTAGAQAQSPSSRPLPDWSGVWAMQGNTVFDRASVQPPTGRAGDAGVREAPPYNDEWEAIYRRNIDRVKAGAFPDPVSTCGTPHGFPRIMDVVGLAIAGLLPDDQKGVYAPDGEGLDEARQVLQAV